MTENNNNLRSNLAGIDYVLFAIDLKTGKLYNKEEATSGDYQIALFIQNKNETTYEWPLLSLMSQASGEGNDALAEGALYSEDQNSISLKPGNQLYLFPKGDGQETTLVEHFVAKLTGNELGEDENQADQAAALTMLFRDSAPMSSIPGLTNEVIWTTLLQNVSKESERVHFADSLSALEEAWRAEQDKPEESSNDDSTNDEDSSASDNSSDGNSSDEDSVSDDEENKPSEDVPDEEVPVDPPMTNGDPNYNDDFGGGFIPADTNIGDGGFEMPTDINNPSDVGVTIKNKPKLIISNYKLNPEMPKAGEEFTIDLTFYNTNYEKAVRNIKISINGAEQTTDATGQTATGSVFSPVNSSNTFYIAEIYAGSTASKQIKLKTVPNAQAQNYTIDVSFEYEDREGNEFTASEIIGVPIVQKSEILYGEVNAPSGPMGMPTTVSMDFYNTGKDTLTTMMVSIEGENLETMDSPRYFVGNFAPGSSDSYSVDVTPMQSGPVEGKVVFTYEDSTGTAHRDEQPFTMDVMEEMVFEDVQFDPETGFPIDSETGQLIDPSTGMPVENDNMLTNPFLWGGIALALIIIALLLRRRLRRKKSDDDLTIDE